MSRPFPEVQTKDLHVRSLRVEAVTRPLGIETGTPRLSWSIESERRAVWQMAYRVQVATRPEDLVDGQADLWDSGRQESDRMLVTYAGARLRSRGVCFWKVQVWDNFGHCASSDVESWEMGITEPEDWRAQWILAEDRTQRADRAVGMRWVRGPAPARGLATRFRLAFEVSYDCRATVCVVANGDPTMHLDGDVVARAIESAVVGLGPTKQIVVDLAAGRHVIALELLDPLPAALGIDGCGLGFVGAEFAYLVRLQFPGLPTTQYVQGDWRTSPSDDMDWRNPEYDDESWTLAERVTDVRPVTMPQQAAVLMRRSFTISQPVRRARLLCTALGAYQLYVNGSRAGDAALTPPPSDFRRRVYYEVMDVTSHICVGRNTLAALVGDGWYASRVWIMGRYPWGAAPRMLRSQLELTFEDDSTQVIATDEQWRIAASAVVSSDIYDGEFYDARLEEQGWAKSEFDDRHWESVRLGAAPAVALTSMYGRPVRSTETMGPVALTNLPSGKVIFDFGQNFAGWCRLQVTGGRGTTIELKFGELLTPAGEVDQSNLGPARATDTFVLAGTGKPETFEPHFTYHGFRYVEVSGLPVAATFDTLVGVVVHSDLGITARFALTEPLLQKLWDNTLWSQRSNFMGIPTDCPQRGERLGWLGDANAFWDAATTNMDSQEFTERYMKLVRDAQTSGGDFPDFVPGGFRLEATANGLLKAVPDWTNQESIAGSSPGWGDAGISLPWMVWQRYGDPQIINDNWVAMTRYLASIEARNTQRLWQHGRGADFGDWLSLTPATQEDADTSKEIVATCMWAGSLMRMEQMAKATGREAAAEHYRRLRKAVRAAFANAFVKEDGAVGNGCQTHQVLALHFQLIPAPLRGIATARLADDIARRGGALSTGFLGTPYILDVLADEGYVSLVYTLLLRREFPSWGYMVARGATTVWENWSGYNGNVPCSRNHYALGAVCGFIFRRIAGISPLTPGYRRIAFSPLPDARIRASRAVFQSVRGPITLEWACHNSETVEYRVGVPANTEGVLRVPLAKQSTISGSRRAMRSRRALLRTIGYAAILDLGPGEYRFTIETTQSSARV